MEQEMLDKWIEKYEELNRQSNEWWRRYKEHKKANNDARAARAERRMDDLEARKLGMEDALDAFCYVVILQGGKFKRIEERK